jgi:hypothetical protein
MYARRDDEPAKRCSTKRQDSRFAQRERAARRVAAKDGGHDSRPVHPWRLVARVLAGDGLDSLASKADLA